MRPRRGLLHLVTLVAVASSCEQPAAPIGRGPFLGVMRLESGRVAIVDVSARRVIDRWGSELGRHQSWPALSQDSSVLSYAAYRDEDRAISFEALDARRGTVLWTRSVSLSPQLTTDGTTTIRFDGLPAVAATPDPTSLFVLTVMGNGQEGIARLDAATGRFTNFVAIHVGGRRAVLLRGRTGLPPGTLAILGTRKASVRPKADALFFVGPDLAILDSVPLPSPAVEALDLAVAPDERSAFIRSPPYLYKLDLAARAVAARVTDFASGGIALSATGELLFATDAGVNLDIPSSGNVNLYNAALVPVATIDLRSFAPEGPPTLSHAITNPTGTVAFVTAGTGVGTLGQRPQKASIFVIDLVRRVPTARIPLGEYGFVNLFWIP